MFPVSVVDGRLPARAPVIGVRYGHVTRAYPVQRILERGVVRQELGGGRFVLEARSEGPTVAVKEAPAGALVVHTFWFAWYAFHPDTEVFGDIATAP